MADAVKLMSVLPVKRSGGSSKSEAFEKENSES
jgi:hypothetical protein